MGALLTGWLPFGSTPDPAGPEPIGALPIGALLTGALLTGALLTGALLTGADGGTGGAVRVAAAGADGTFGTARGTSGPARCRLAATGCSVGVATGVSVADALRGGVSAASSLDAEPVGTVMPSGSSVEIDGEVVGSQPAFDGSGRSSVGAASVTISGRFDGSKAENGAGDSVADGAGRFDAGWKAENVDGSYVVGGS